MFKVFPYPDHID